MNVKQMIETLATMDPEADVHFVYNYGDHGRTLVAPLARYVAEGYVKHSEYHNMDQVMSSEAAEDPKQALEIKDVVLIWSFGNPTHRRGT